MSTSVYRHHGGHLHYREEKRHLMLCAEKWTDVDILPYSMLSLEQSRKEASNIEDIREDAAE